MTYDGLADTTEYVSNWVGIGGYDDSTLIQLGSMEIAPTSGSTSYLVWYELYPASTQLIPNSVKPGDIITASLQCTAACSPSSVQTWQLSMVDHTAGWSWRQSFQYQSSMASAEWITEAPGWPTLPLADYGKTTFDPVEANGLNPNLSLSANGVIMQDPYGETSNPSSPVNGDIFSTCWGSGSLTPCTAGSFTTPPPATTASLSASPKIVSAGQSSTLSWSSINASSCTGNRVADAPNAAIEIAVRLHRRMRQPLEGLRGLSGDRPARDDGSKDSGTQAMRKLCLHQSSPDLLKKNAISARPGCEAGSRKPLR